jgi:DNA repair exonuclease SbcCD ATPase subunit
MFGTRLQQVKEDGKGNQKIVLRPTLLKGGLEIPMEFMSGGQIRRAALAYDLAINQVAAQGLPLLLDEALDALDEQGKLDALALLQEVARERPVFIIDHSGTLISAIDTHWTVISQAGVSRLEP